MLLGQGKSMLLGWNMKTTHREKVSADARPLAGRFEEEPVFTPTNEAGRLVSVEFEHSEVRCCSCALSLRPFSSA